MHAAPRGATESLNRWRQTPRKSVTRTHASATNPMIPCVAAISRRPECVRSYVIPGAQSALKNRPNASPVARSEEHTSELQSRLHLVCRLLLEKKKKKNKQSQTYTNKKQQLS